MPNEEDLINELVGEFQTIPGTTDQGSAVNKGLIDPGAVDLVKKWEGFKTKAYKPTPEDVWTVGYGHTGTAKKGMEIDEQTAEKLLAEDMQGADQAIDKLITQPLNKAQRNAVTSLIYNIGEGAFAKSKALEALNKGDFETFKKEAFDKEKGFVRQKGKVLPGLVNRRKEEQEVFDSFNLTKKEEEKLTGIKNKLGRKLTPEEENKLFALRIELKKQGADEQTILNKIKNYLQGLSYAGIAEAAEFEDPLIEEVISDYQRKEITDSKITFEDQLVNDLVQDFTGEGLTEQEIPEKVPYGYRTSGKPKGRGFLGELKRPDGDISTEISIGVNFDGIETEIPSLVPTLTKEEINHLLSGKPHTREMIDKAVAHARQRMSQGLSPFKELSEEIPEQPTKFPGLGETAVATAEAAKSLAGGILGFIPSVIAQVQMPVILKLAPYIGLDPKMTPQEQAEFTKEVSTFIGTLGGTTHAQTPMGQQAEKIIGVPFEMVHNIAGKMNEGISKEKFPNLHNTAVTASELMMLGFVPKVKNAFQKVAKKQIKALKAKGEAKRKAEAAVEKEIIRATKAAEKAVKAKEFDERIRPYSEQLVKEVNERKQAEVRREDIAAEELARSAQIKPAIEEYARGLQRELKPAEFEPKTTGINPQTALERARTLEEKVIRPELKQPELGREPVSGMERITTEVAKPTTRTEIVSEEGIPRTEYQISPETGKPEMTFSAQERKVYQIGEEGIKLVERVPGKKSVWQIVTEPFEGEGLGKGGFIKIPVPKILRKKLSPERQELIRKAGRAAEQAGMKLHDFLVQGGMTKDEARKFEKLYDFAKEEAPMRAGAEMPKRSPKDFDFFGLKKGEKQVNIGSDANQTMKIGTSDAELIRSIEPRGRSLMSWFKPTEFMFDKYPTLRPLLDQYRELQKVSKKELETASKHVKDLSKQFKDRRLREELGVYWHSLTKSGDKAMQFMRKKPVENPKYIELKNTLQPMFEDMLNEVNRIRVKVGNKPIKGIDDYLAFYAKESLWEDFYNLARGKKIDKQRTNLILDDIDTIMNRQNTSIKDSPAFAHVKRKPVREGINIELDPLAIYARYLNDTVRYKHTAPLNKFVKELIGTEHLDVKTGKMGEPIKITNPNLANDLASWNNAIAGMPNMNVPRGLEKFLRGVNNNLTAAQLFGNVRTTALQPFALHNTWAKFGTKNLGIGIDSMVRKRKTPIEESNVLTNAEMEAGLNDLTNMVTTSKFQRGKQETYRISSAALRKLDYFSREITWRTVYHSLEPLIKQGKMSKREAIRKADQEVIRTQASGDIGEISPVQRNIIGKTLTLWQTFTIGQLNFALADILGKGPGAEKLGIRKRSERLGRYLIGGAAINYLFEDLMGVQSPLPSPEQTLWKSLQAGDPGSDVALKSILELAEAFPGGGSAKFGSHPAGPLFELGGKITKSLARDGYDTQSVLSKAIEGEPRALTTVTEIIGKLAGVPGTAQVTKAIRGVRRGETIPGAIIGTYTPGKIGKKRKSTQRLSGRTAGRERIGIRGR